MSPTRVRPRGASSCAFTLIEVVVVIVILGILSAAVVIPRIGTLRDDATKASEDGVVAAVRAGIHAARMRNVAAGTGSYPDTLDQAALGRASRHNPLFAGVMSRGVTDGRWRKVGPRSYVYDPSGKQYNYNARTGEFSPGAVAGGAPPGGGGTVAGSAPPSAPAPPAASPGPGSSGPTGLTQAEVQSLAPDEIVPANLTPQQMSWLTYDQYSQLSQSQLDQLSEAQKAALASKASSLSSQELAGLSNAMLALMAPELSGQQVAGLSNEQFEQIVSKLSAAQIAAATPEQIAMLSRQAYENLTPAQKAALTAKQRAERELADWIRSLRYPQFPSLSPEQIKYLTPAQIATIPNDWWLARIPTDSRHALTARQIQALRVDRTGIGLLSEQQRTYLLTSQVQKLRYSQFRHLPADRIAELTPQQIASIPNDWWLARFSAEARAKLTAQQVQALQVDRTGIGLLTAQQRTYLTTAQVQKLRYSQLRYVPVDRVPELTPQQIASIPNDWWFKRFSSEAIAALTAEQVAALRPEVYDRVKHLLTADQIAMRQ